MKRAACLMATLLLTPAALVSQQGEGYRIHAIRYGTIPQFRVSSLVRGADPDERLDIAMVFWLVRGEGHTILFDTGFHHSQWFERFEVEDFISPAEAVTLAGVSAEDVTDVIVSHAHWDHMGGIDLFPNANLWIQAEEFAYYTGPAWQDNGRGGGSDPEDLIELVRRNTLGQVKMIDGDSIEIMPGITVFTGARHTFASQYVLVSGNPVTVLASDNAYLFRNLEQLRPVATFTPADSTANLTAIRRMLRLAGSIDNIVPGHDPEQFDRFPTTGRVATIR